MPRDRRPQPIENAHPISRATFEACGFCRVTEKRSTSFRNLSILRRSAALNAITDVAGVEVGFTTLIEREGPLQIGKGPVRTGVTAILPRGKASGDPVMAGWFSLNGNGEMTGTTWIKEGGFLEGPIFITN